MIEEAFEVATEFRFDVGQAIIGTKALTDSVDGLSHSVDGALSSLNYLASGLVAHLGIGAGGLLGIVTRGIQLTEEFTRGSMGFVNSISSNMQVLGGTIGTFNDQLETSKMLMGNINSAAGKLGLSGVELAQMTQLLASPLAQRGKLGTNYSTGIELAKNAMITGEATGLGHGNVAESLLRGLSPGGAVMGKLFERMVNTQAFHNARVTRPQQLSGMGQDKKMDLLISAMSELGNNAGYLTARLDSLRVQFNILKANVENILRPIGDALKVPLMKMLRSANTFLTAHSTALGASIGKLLNNLVDDPKKAFVNLMQLKSLGTDFKKALHITELVQMFLFLRWGLGLLGVELGGGLLKQGIGYLITFIGQIAKFIWSTGILGSIFGYLIKAAAAVGEVFLPLLFFFQILSRARAIATLNDTIAWFEIVPEMADAFVRLKDALSAVFLPITMVIDQWGKMLAPIFEWSIWIRMLVPLMEGMAWVLEWIGAGVIYMTAGLNALVSVIMGFIYDIINLKNPMTDAMTNLKDGFNDFLKAHPVPGSGSTPTTKSVVTNNNHIEARFDMREQLEPDRIAFSVTQHLKKLAINATQGRGQSMQAAFAGNQIVTGG